MGEQFVEIQLSNSAAVAIVDADDADKVSAYRWRLTWDKFRSPMAVRADFNGAYALLHRLILGAPKGSIVDHVNGDVLDNRRCNLRICTHAENMRNSKTRKHSALGIRNVSLGNKGDDGPPRWRAVVRHNGKVYRKWFGPTESGRVAAEAWAKEKRAELHGAFAVDNRNDKNPLTTRARGG